MLLAIPILSDLTKRNENVYLYRHVITAAIHKSPQMEITQMSINW